MMLILVLGDVGTGKTLLTTILAYLSHKKGVEVYSNYTLNFPYKKLTVNMIYNIKKGLVLLDEAYTWLEARISGSKLNRFLSYILFQSRKRGLNWILTAQLGSVIELRFREMSDYVIYSDICDLGFSYEVYKKTKYGFVKINSFRLPYENAEQFFSLYDTYEVIPPFRLEEMQLEFMTPEEFNLTVKRVADEIIKKFSNVENWTKDKVLYALKKLGYSRDLAKYVYLEIKHGGEFEQTD